VDRVRGMAGWRSAVLAVEVLVAVACVFAGWRLVARPNPGSGVEVYRGASAPAEEPPGFLGLPQAPGAAPRAQVEPGVAPLTDLIKRVNADDLRLYRTQWQVIQLLADGTRRYIELKVLPVLSAA
jgi:hypothetical protein